VKGRAPSRQPSDGANINRELAVGPASQEGEGRRLLGDREAHHAKRGSLLI